MNWLIGPLALVIGFSTLVFVHELGHYVLAKWNGVRVKVFSIGMGPYLISFTRGETVYALSLVPIGGYVKMLGQEDMHPDIDPSKDPHDYRNKRPGQRAAILAAGAGFNLIFAFFAFAFCYYMGVEMDAPRIGHVDSESPIAKAQTVDANGNRVPAPLQKGDLIRSIDGVPMRTFMDVSLYVAGSGKDRELQIDYDRDDKPAQNPVFVRTEFNKNLGAPVIGMERFAKKEPHDFGFEVQENAVYVRSCTPGSPAETAKLQTRDRVLSVDGKQVLETADLVTYIRAGKGAEQTLAIDRDGQIQELKIKARLEQPPGTTEEKDKRYMIGLMMIEGPVVRISKDSDAYAGGLREGFFITEVEKLRDKEHIRLTYLDLRDPKAEENSVILPLEPRSPSDYLYTFSAPEQVEIKCDTVVESLALAWSDVIRHSTAVFTVVKGLMMGAISPKALSSPLGIGRAMLQVSVERPAIYYFWFLAFLSVNLGVLQFVPIPLLDGWHLLTVGLEKLKGGPLPQKFLIYSQYVGLFIILGLLAFALLNDIKRF
ncbi:MAG: RIP metalloprotease RseP [Planctomycetota bacterium]|nr:RIP metalloprotease RseP [Planctomycetota bacterium]